MKIIIRNLPILLISQVLLASYLPTPLNTAQAANTALTEAPPPWAARQDALVAAPLPTAATETLSQARTQVTNNHSIEQWYAQRQTYAVPAKSAPELKTKATQGDLNAQYALALQLRQDPSPENIAESLKLQEKAARGGHVEAQYGLGVMYSNGQYVVQDQRLASFWYSQAAKRGSEAAQLALGSLPAEVVAAPRAKVASVPQTMAPRANTNEVAESVVVNNNESMFAVSESAARAEMPAMSAEEYAALEAGANTPPEPELMQPAEGAAGAEGTPELVAAAPEAEAGDISVEHNESKVDLGNRSVQEVVNAAQKGDMYAQLMLGALFEDGTDPDIPQDSKEAAKWYAKAAKQGYPKAQHNLALLYEDGRGVTQSYTEAAKWYAKAAKAGFSEAQNNLAVLYIMGNGVKQDRAQAEKLLTAAVGQGNENARRNLQKLLEGTAS